MLSMQVYFNRSTFTGEVYTKYNNTAIFLALVCPVEDAVYFGIWELIEEKYEVTLT